MASIDDVIARSRQAGEFSERRRFTVARQSAIRKMRKFALADPSYYILELIQAAVANGATYIDVQAQQAEVTMSYVGGGFAGDELAQIFDFLFASKDRLDLADIRQLALGINALLLAEPDAIVIESGRGTLESTTRIEVNPRENVVDVGTPSAALDGTFVRATGLNRSKLGGHRPKEGIVIESRCLAAPVPVLYNNQPLFGYRTMRTPNLFGFAKSIAFDEGDLYGTLGISRTLSQAQIKLLTFGVWIESVHDELAVADARFGGVVAFDKLRKSADHAGIVKDEVYQELWARLRPYARQLVEGRTGRAVLDIHALDGGELTALEIRDRAAETGRIVSFPRAAVDSPERTVLARRIGQAIGGPVVLVGPSEAATLELIVRDTAELYSPPLRDDALDFFQRPEDELPARPWLTGVEYVEDTSVAEFYGWLRSEGLIRQNGRLDQALSKISGRGTIEGSVVTPVHDYSPGMLHVQVCTSKRIVWQGGIPSAYPGHVLVIELPDVEARALVAEIPGSTVNGAELIAEVYAHHALEALSRAATSVINSLSHRPPSADNAAARISLMSAARSTMRRIHRDGDAERIEFVRVDENLPEEILTYPVVKTLDGAEHSIRDLEAMMHATSGLLYGVIPEVKADLEGLDRSRILDIDQAQERAVIALVGDASYVRVDARDVLVDIEGVQVRDIAIGLREYADDLPLLVEGELHRLRERPQLREDIVRELIQIYRGRNPVLGQAEFRRQAARHLVYVLAQTVDGPARSGALQTAAELPLFLTGEGATSFEGLEAARAVHGRIPMLDGWAVDTARLADGAPEVALSDFVEAPVLAMNPFAFHTLHGLGVTSAFDFDLDPAEEADEMRFLAIVDDLEDLEGQVGVPCEPVHHPAIAVVDGTNQRVWALRSAANEFGIVGRLKATFPLDEEHITLVEQRCMMAGFTLLADLVDRLSTMSPEEYQAALSHLLGFAARHVELYRGPRGRVGWETRHEMAARILSLPVFPTRERVWVTGERLIRAFVDAQNQPAYGGWETLLAESAGVVERRWCEDLLTAESIITEPSTDADAVDDGKALPVVRSSDDARIEAWLADALDALRTERATQRFEVRIVETDADRISPVFRYLGGERARLEIRADADLLVRVRESQMGKDALIWLLMAAYAHINEVLAEVTNRHEREFQARLIHFMEGDNGI